MATAAARLRLATRHRAPPQGRAPSGVYGSQDPKTALDHVISSDMAALYIFHGLGPELEKPDVADLVREAAHRLAGHSGAVVLTGADVRLPETLRTEVGQVRVPMPVREDYASIQRARRQGPPPRTWGSR